MGKGFKAIELDSGMCQPPVFECSMIVWHGPLRICGSGLRVHVAAAEVTHMHVTRATSKCNSTDRNSTSMMNVPQSSRNMH